MDTRGKTTSRGDEEIDIKNISKLFESFQESLLNSIRIFNAQLRTDVQNLSNSIQTELQASNQITTKELQENNLLLNLPKRMEKEISYEDKEIVYEEKENLNEEIFRELEADENTNSLLKKKTRSRIKEERHIKFKMAKIRKLKIKYKKLISNEEVNINMKKKRLKNTKNINYPERREMIHQWKKKIKLNSMFHRVKWKEKKIRKSLAHL